MLYDKNQFSREELAPANTRTTLVVFTMLSILSHAEENKKRLAKAWPYFTQGELLAYNNASFHEYDINLAYVMSVPYVTELDFEIDDDIEDDDIDSEYYSRRFNARDRKTPDWSNSKDEAIVYFLPSKEYEYFVHLDQGTSWYFSSDPHELDFADYHGPVEIKSLEHLNTLIDKELIRAVRCWELSKDNY